MRGGGSVVIKNFENISVNDYTSQDNEELILPFAF